MLLGREVFMIGTIGILTAAIRMRELYHIRQTAKFIK
jgi:hypothetical protein